MPVGQEAFAEVGTDKTRSTRYQYLHVFINSVSYIIMQLYHAALRLLSPEADALRSQGGQEIAQGESFLGREVTRPPVAPMHQGQSGREHAGGGLEVAAGGPVDDFRPPAVPGSPYFHVEAGEGILSARPVQAFKRHSHTVIEQFLQVFGEQVGSPGEGVDQVRRDGDVQPSLGLYLHDPRQAVRQGQRFRLA